MDVHDDLWARTLVLEQGETTWALVSLDLVGFFNDDINKMRERARAEGIDIDHITVTSTHVHAGPDTLGQWGKRAGVTGRNHDYLAYLEDQIIESLKDAVATKEETTMRIGSVDVSTYSEKGSQYHLRPSRSERFRSNVECSYLREFGGGANTLMSFGNIQGHLKCLTSDFSDRALVWNRCYLSRYC